ncbi:hypothetical protein TNCV_2612251 [Trichonephila clavipes]|nr:hypothetical protein TNCV_2612251 [Trichonephila clavipes]
MSVQTFLKLEEALELLKSLDSDESNIEIAVLSDTNELTDEDEGVIMKQILVRLLKKMFLGLWRLELEIVYRQTHPQALVFRQQRAEKRLKDISCFGDLGIILLKNAMPRNQFQKLKSYSHFVDDGTINHHVQDRSFKVKPLFAILNNNFMKFKGEYERTNKDKVNEKLPNLINSYNKHMGYVDPHDWLAGIR